MTAFKRFPNHLLIVRLKNKAWLAEIIEKYNQVPLKNPEEDPLSFSSYLFPELENKAQEEDFLEKNYQTLFENELAIWCPDKSYWPKERNFSTFKSMFEVEFQYAVYLKN